MESTSAEAPKKTSLKGPAKKPARLNRRKSTLERLGLVNKTEVVRLERRHSMKLQQQGLIPKEEEEKVDWSTAISPDAKAMSPDRKPRQSERSQTPGPSFVDNTEKETSSTAGSDTSFFFCAVCV
eukprot:CAMPEP_0119541370 /NCGR_PEP_ID=MMETSP1344-20130328/52920_1 /TAXON_ID=236787 /ORGANISM="Florenciella parvula, Strain CCMP2471" /LENGTH=124 /DNA_ID=CAMNT_0007585337 /DNA_START=221 /DNA_END=595 /DNA_ORIENTATION=+